MAEKDQQKEPQAVAGLTEEEKMLLAEMEQQERAEPEEEGETAEASKSGSEGEDAEEGSPEMILRPETVEAIGKALNALLVDVLNYIKLPAGNNPDAS